MKRPPKPTSAPSVEPKPTVNTRTPWLAAMRAQLDEEALKQVADMTKGQYFRATNSTELKKIYQGLNTQLIKETRETEITALFSVAAAALALTAAGLSMLWFGRIV